MCSTCPWESHLYLVVDSSTVLLFSRIHLTATILSCCHQDLLVASILPLSRPVAVAVSVDQG